VRVKADGEALFADSIAALAMLPLGYFIMSNSKTNLDIY
jgi:hypothetical protein